MPTSTPPLRRYLLTLTLTAAAFLALVAAGNVAMDPLWCFGTRHPLNARTHGFDERQQKTNLLAFAKPDFDAVIVGTSRSTYIDARDVPGVKAFNYAISGLQLDEMPSYVEYASKQAPGGLRAVIIGLDFGATREPIRMARKPLPPEVPFDRVADPAYRLKTALSWEALTHAFDDLQLPPTREYYDRDWRKHHGLMDDRLILTWTNRNARYQRRLLGNGYRYDPTYRDRIARVRESAGSARIYAFTTPVSTSLLEILREEGRSEDYRRWLRELVATFGEIHHFMDANGITRDARNFMDGHHVRPEVGRLIARRVMGAPTPEAPADFGIRLDAEDLEAYMARESPWGAPARR